jgi:transcriptional regulator with XRE-family HTH domain
MTDSRLVPVAGEHTPRLHRRPSPELIRRFASNVAALREARGWTQEDLARRCHCHRNFISNIEQGRVNATLGTLEMLSCGFRCTESELILPGRFEIVPRG